MTRVNDTTGCFGAYLIHQVRGLSTSFIVVGLSLFQADAVKLSAPIIIRRLAASASRLSHLSVRAMQTGVMWVTLQRALIRCSAVRALHCGKSRPVLTQRHITTTQSCRHFSLSLSCHLNELND